MDQKNKDRLKNKPTKKRGKKGNQDKKPALIPPTPDDQIIQALQFIRNAVDNSPCQNKQHRSQLDGAFAVLVNRVFPDGVVDKKTPETKTVEKKK